MAAAKYRNKQLNLNDQIKKEEKTRTNERSKL